MNDAINIAVEQLEVRRNELYKELEELEVAINTLKKVSGVKITKVEEKQEVAKLVTKEKKIKLKRKASTGRVQKVLDYVALNPGTERAAVSRNVNVENLGSSFEYDRNYSTLQGLIKAERLILKDNKVYLPQAIIQNLAPSNYEPDLREKMVIAALKQRGGRATISTIAMNLANGENSYASDLRECMHKMLSKGVLRKSGQMIEMNVTINAK